MFVAYHQKAIFLLNLGRKFDMMMRARVEIEINFNAILAFKSYLLISRQTLKFFLNLAEKAYP